MLWNRIKVKLAAKYPNLDERVDLLHQVPAVKDRASGREWSDREVFEALILSILSNATEWSKVETVRDEIGTLFQQFDIAWYANISPSRVKDVFIPWFQNRRAGSVSQSKDLTTTIQTAQEFLELIAQHGSLEAYFKFLLVRRNLDLPSLAVALGGSKSYTKIPGLGIPLAAEFLKNIGYDVAKPDRHIIRAAGAFGWVAFKKWPDRTGTTAPTTTDSVREVVMRAVQTFAIENHMMSSYIDNSVWLLCSKSGLSMTNAALAELAGKQFGGL